MSKPKKIGITNALALMKESKGKFFTVVFDTKKESDRVLNGQYLSTQKPSELGYVKMREKKNSQIRHVNMQTLKEVRINKTVYIIKR